MEKEEVFKTSSRTVLEVVCRVLQTIIMQIEGFHFEANVSLKMFMSSFGRMSDLAMCR